MMALGATAYLAAKGFEAELARELGPDCTNDGRLFFALGPARPAAWAANVWFDPVWIPIVSIGEGAKALRAIQRSWALFATCHHGRAKLIQDRLPPIGAKPLVFPQPPPAAPLGSWTLQDANTIVAAARCSSPLPHGEMMFVEDRAGPPSRAYLKLWEALTRLGRSPRPGETCIDLGASPGGWTWVIQSLGAHVIAVDKAPLDPAVAALHHVEMRTQSAFALAPGDVPPADWLFSDIIAYPGRLFRLIMLWIESGRARNIVCTIKFQGETDLAAQAAFQSIPGAQVFHLHHNKHELTFARLLD